jgi:histidyl-tRNA synthetase
VGISIGVTRLLGLLFGAGALSVSRSVPTAVLVAVTAEEQRAASNRVAEALRRRGVPTEVSPSAAKFGKQIRYAERRGVPYVWFPGAEGAPDEVKDIRSGEQTTAVADRWSPPVADLTPLVG